MKSPASVIYDSDGTKINVIGRSLAVYPMNSVTASPGKLLLKNIKNGSNDNMVVDGATTPVVFTMNADAVYDLYISELRLVITTLDIIYNYSYFIEKPGLANGCLLELNSESSNYVLANFKKTEDFLQLPAAPGLMTTMGTSDIMAVSYMLPRIKLVHNSADNVKMTIRDTINDNHIRFGFTCTVIGEMVTP